MHVKYYIIITSEEIMTTENEYFTKLFRDTDKLLAALDALDKAHPSFSTIKYKLNREAGVIADLITSCRRSIQFLKDDPACKQSWTTMRSF